MIYGETSGTNPDDIYQSEQELRFFLLLETGDFLLLETGAKFLLENSIVFQEDIYLDTSGTSPDEIYEQESTSGSLFETTSGTNPDPIYEDD